MSSVTTWKGRKRKPRDNTRTRETNFLRSGIFIQLQCHILFYVSYSKVLLLCVEWSCCALRSIKNFISTYTYKRVHVWLDGDVKWLKHFEMTNNTSMFCMIILVYISLGVSGKRGCETKNQVSRISYIFECWVSQRG